MHFRGLQTIRNILYLRAAVHQNEEPKVYNSVKTFLQCGEKHAGADYLYLFDGEAWFYTDTYGPRNKRSFEEVEMNLETV
jgi:hypothetical protein